MTNDKPGVGEQPASSAPAEALTDEQIDKLFDSTFVGSHPHRDFARAILAAAPAAAPHAAPEPPAEWLQGIRRAADRAPPAEQAPTPDYERGYNEAIASCAALGWKTPAAPQAAPEPPALALPKMHGYLMHRLLDLTDRQRRTLVPEIEDYAKACVSAALAAPESASPAGKS